MNDIGLISIIMAVYNAETTIDDAVRSVLHQTYRNWELMIILDCPTDHTCLRLEAYHDPRIHILHNETRQGVSRTRYTGAVHACGEWISVLDSDDAWAPEKLEKQADLQVQTKAELLYTGSGFMDEAGHLKTWIFHVPAAVNYQELLKQNVISNSSSLVKKSLYLEHCGFNDDIHEDYAIWLKILKSGTLAYGVDEPLLIRRLRVNSKSSNKLKSAQMNWLTYRELGLNIRESLYDLCCYAVRSIRKYSHLR